MFSDNLTGNLLQICDEEHLSYETAAERCGISVSYFGRIIRKKASPSLNVLERICAGLHATPDALLGRPKSSSDRHSSGEFLRRVK